MKKIKQILLLVLLFVKFIVNAQTYDIDIGVSRIEYPSQYIIQGTDSVLSINPVVIIKNYGTTPQSNFIVEYQIATLNSVQQICDSVILPGDSIRYTFSLPYNNPFAYYNICSRTKLMNDSNSVNDEYCMTVIVSLEDMQPEVDKFYLAQNYPNPASTTTTVLYTSEVSDVIILTVRDMQGKLIYQREEIAKIGENSIKLDTKNYADGIYLINLQLGSENQNRTLIIKK